MTPHLEKVGDGRRGKGGARQIRQKNESLKGSREERSERPR